MSDDVVGRSQARSRGAAGDGGRHTAPEVDRVRRVYYSFRYVVAGDTVTRILGGAPMHLRVTEVDERLIYCGPKPGGWKFDRATGIEVDEMIGSGPEFGVAASYLIHPMESEEGQP